MVSYGKPFVAIFKTDFLFISICKSQLFSMFQAICKARFTFNARFNIQWTVQCSMHVQYLLNHSMFNKTLNVQLVIQGFNNTGNNSAFSLISSVQCSIHCSINYIMFSEQFNVQCIFNIQWTIQCLYNNPSYSCILIGSCLWSIRGHTHRWRQLSIQVFFKFF